MQSQRQPESSARAQLFTLLIVACRYLTELISLSHSRVCVCAWQFGNFYVHYSSRCAVSGYFLLRLWASVEVIHVLISDIMLPAERIFVCVCCCCLFVCLFGVFFFFLHVFPQPIAVCAMLTQPCKSQLVKGKELGHLSSRIISTFVLCYDSCLADMAMHIQSYTERILRRFLIHPLEFSVCLLSRKLSVSWPWQPRYMYVCTYT